MSFQVYRQTLNEAGYIHLKGVLSANEISALLSAVDKLVKQHVSDHKELHSPMSSFGKGAFRIYQAIEKFDALDCLIDHPQIFDLLVYLIGPYIQVMGTEIFIRNPHDSFAERFHTDAGPAMQKFTYHDDLPLLQLKVQFFLTDTLKENHGNFMCIPGTHRIPASQHLPGCFISEANSSLEHGELPLNTYQFLAKAGDVVIFPWCLWHGATNNLGTETRRSVCFRYGQLWCRPYDYVTLPQEKMNKLTLRQRRLFGDVTKRNGENFDASDYYKIQDQTDIICSA